MSDVKMLIIETLMCTCNKTQHLADVFSGLNILFKICFIFFREMALCLDLLDSWVCPVVNVAKFLISEVPTRLWLSLFLLHQINYSHKLTEWLSDNTSHFLFWSLWDLVPSLLIHSIVQVFIQLELKKLSFFYHAYLCFSKSALWLAWLICKKANHFFYRCGGGERSHVEHSCKE